MMRFIMILVALYTMILTIDSPSPVYADQKPASLMLLYSNNVNGETEPCG